MVYWSCPEVIVIATCECRSAGTSCLNYLKKLLMPKFTMNFTNPFLRIMKNINLAVMQARVNAISDFSDRWAPKFFWKKIIFFYFILLSVLSTINWFFSKLIANFDKKFALDHRVIFWWLIILWTYRAPKNFLKIYYFFYFILLSVLSTINWFFSKLIASVDKKLVEIAFTLMQAIIIIQL